MQADETSLAVTTVAGQQGKAVHAGLIHPGGGMVPQGRVTQSQLFIRNDGWLVPEHTVQDVTVSLVQQDDHGGVW